MSDDHDSNTNDSGASLQERMAAVARGDNPALTAARSHLGTDEPRGSVEDAMIAGADLETGEIFDPMLSRDATDVAEVLDGKEPPPEFLRNAPPEPPAEAPKAEIVEPERAADGMPAPFAARDTGSLINLLEGGQFSTDVIAAMTALATGMTEIAQATGKRQKGVLTIKVNLQTDDTGEAFFVQGDFAVRAPKVERRKTLLWPDEKGHMSPSQPRQKVFFGVRDVGGGPRQIRDATAERRPL